LEQEAKPEAIADASRTRRPGGGPEAIAEDTPVSENIFTFPQSISRNFFILKHPHIKPETFETLFPGAEIKLQN
jgi:hypothetical protein